MKSSSGIFLSIKNIILVVAFAVVVLGAVVGWGEYRRVSLGNEIMVQSKSNADKIAELASSSVAFQIALDELNQKFHNLMNDSVALSGAIQNEKEKNDAIQEQVGNVSSTIGALDKLSKLDPELLKKYSKIYFLNEHYTPSGLAAVMPEFTYNKDIKYQIHTGIVNNFYAMLRAANSQGVYPLVISAYRSFGTQTALKTTYKMTFGTTKANQFSADQGYSEHQLGTTLDFTNAKDGAVLEGFDKTAEFTWLTNNAYKYGFVMSYPKGNAYYIYEPWHWRYVGVDLAQKLHRDNQNFYDADQRVIDNYLLLIFN